MRLSVSWSQINLAKTGRMLEDKRCASLPSPPSSREILKMLRIESSNSGKHRTPRNYFSRREQYRLLLLVFSLLTVFFLMQEAGRPANWQWLWGTNAVSKGPPVSEGHTASQNVSSELQGNKEIDTRLREAVESPLPDGALVIEKSHTDSAPSPVNVEALLSGQVNVDLSVIRDNTVFRGAEAEAWYTILATLRDARLEDLQKAPAESAGFTQLFRQPDEYRGRLVRVAGDVRRAHFIQSHDNEHNIEGYWQCWLFPPGSKNPLVVYSLEMPVGFPKGMQISECVEFVGVSYKLWAYQAVKDILTAPLVMAKTGLWQPKVVAPPAALPSRQLVALAVVLAALGAIGVVMWVYRRSSDLSAKVSSYDELRKSANRDSLDDVQAGPETGEFLDTLAGEPPEKGAR